MLAWPRWHVWPVANPSSCSSASSSCEPGLQLRECFCGVFLVSQTSTLEWQCVRDLQGRHCRTKGGCMHVSKLPPTLHTCAPHTCVNAPLSSKREPLGRPYVRGHKLPEGLGTDRAFGKPVDALVSTNASWCWNQSRWHQQYQHIIVVFGVGVAVGVELRCGSGSRCGCCTAHRAAMSARLKLRSTFLGGWCPPPLLLLV